MSIFNLDALAWKEGDQWVIQFLQRDIRIQEKRLGDFDKAIQLKLKGEARMSEQGDFYPFLSNLQPAPKNIHDRWKKVEDGAYYQYSRFQTEYKSEFLPITRFKVRVRFEKPVYIPD